MWGCLKTIFIGLVVVFALLFIFIGGGWWYVGTTSFEGLVKLRVERTLEARLGRDVTIGGIHIVRARPQRVILNDLRIANAPGGVAPYFARVRQVEITGGIESFWGRNIKVSRVDVRDPQLWFEVFPAGSQLTHNFPQWKTGPKRRYEIYRLDIGKLYISNGLFSFLDRKHDIAAVARNIDSTVTVTRAEGLYAGIMTSPLLRVRLQDYQEIDLSLRGGFRYTPGVLALQSIALRGRGIEAFLSGKLDPLTEGAYDLRLDSRLELARIREIFRVEKTLEGTLILDTTLRGKQGDFRLAGGWRSPRITADTYDLANVQGTLDVNENNLALEVTKANYGGGTINADYALAQYSEPYPMTLDLRHSGISLEQLFSDWTIENTGLRGAATGRLTYRWNKDKVLEGAGEGTARLAKSTTAFSNAQYPVPVAGTLDYALDKGTVTFRRAELDTQSSHVSLTGKLKIEGVVTDLAMTIRSTDFAELDRIGYNFAHAADKRDYTLLGLGGAGTITGTVKGPIDKPLVVANITASQTRYNEVLLGDADIALRYDGTKSVLTFDRAVFRDAGGSIAINGTVGFPETGGPRFDIAVDASGYPAQRAIDAVGLDLKIGSGLATGKMVVAGTPENGRATFANVVIRRADATLRLNGDVNWLPGEGNAVFDLDIAATNFPIADIAAFLDFEGVPVAGDLTGTLRIKGPKDKLEGSGTVTVRKGSIMGEPIDLASADIAFTEGRMKATNVVVRAPAGEIRGEAELDLGTEKFSYTITSSALDPAKLKILAGLGDLFGGTLTIKSTGAGTFTQPELVVEVALSNAILRGLELPAGTAPPSLYLAIRGGKLIVRGSVADIVTIEGEGTVGENMAVDGNVRVTIADLAKAMALSPMTSSLPASGNIVLDLKLGGKLTPIEALIVEATTPVFDVRIGDHAFSTPEPLRVTLRNGRIELDSVVLVSPDSSFTATGFAEITGNKRLDVDLRGRIEAALLQLFVPDMRAEGHMDVEVSVDGALASPRVTGTATLEDAEVKFAGFPQLIDQINGTLRFRGDRIEIESIRATVGGGKVVAGGFIVLDGMMPKSVRISLQGSDVALRYYEGLTLQGDFALLLSGDLNQALLAGDIAVTRALYFRDFELQQTLLNVILSRSRVVPTTAATWQDRIGLRIHLTAPETLAVRNNIAEVTGSAELDVTGTLANPVILGEVTLAEGGRVRIQNVDYRVVRGTITFQNPFRIDPFFDLTIEGTVSGGVSEIESGPLEVTVNITGTIDRITPSITSDPPASDITLFSILGFGGLGGGIGGQQQPGVGLVGQGLLYQSVINLIGARVFPFVDSFAYDPGTLDTGSGSGPKVTFEKRLSDRIRFLLVYNLDNDESRQVVEWLVNRDWTLQLTRDETDEYRLDARFRRRYEAHWELGQREEGELASTAVMRGPGGAAGSQPAASQPIGPAPPVTAVNPIAAQDRPISQINFRADARFDTSTLAREVTLQPGQQVSIRELQSSIKNLFATGNFRDVRVDAANVDGGVVLTFSLFLHYRIDEIQIAGVAGRERTRAQRELTVRSGEILSLDDVDDSAAAIQEAMQQNGYLDATVDPETSFDRARSLADVTFHVAAGDKAEVTNVVIQGSLAPFNAQQLLGAMRHRPGRTFQLLEAREDAGRIKNFLVRRNYRRADVDFLRYDYDRTTHGVVLHYHVNIGPVVQVAVTGVPRNSVRRWLPFGRNQEYSEDVIDQAADRIVRGLQERGHFNAAVDTESNLEDNVWTTTFHVRPGARYRLAEVTFSGNIKESDKHLQEAVATSPRGGWRRALMTLFRRPQGVTREQLGDDRDSIEAHYRLEGFSEAAIDTPVVNTNDATGTMTVDFPITEGPQTLVTSLKVEGPEQVAAEDLPDLQLEAGEPLNPQLLHEDVVALQTFYADRGNVEVQVAPRIDMTADKTGATVAYVITEGPQVDIDDVTVRGNTYTDSEVVLRKAELEKGDPFSYTSILEAQRQLYRLGIFQRVDIQPEQAGTSVGDRDVVIQVEEGKNLTLSGSVGLRLERGAQDADLTGEDGEEDNEEEPQEGEGGSGSRIEERFAIAAAHRNLFGTGRYLGLEAVVSGNEQEYFITYREPFISRWNVPLQVQVFQSDDSTRPGTHILQRGSSIEATKVAGLQTRWSVRYEYKISECIEGGICDLLKTETGEEVPVEGLDRSLLDIQISSIAPTFFWDRRDDIIDPHRGFFTSASIEYAFPLFSADANFLKEYVQGAFYIPVSARSVVALSGRIGLIQPLGETDHSNVPLSERFTAGGENSHRAFGLDRLGNLCRDEADFVDGTCDATLFQRFNDKENRFEGPILPLGGSGLFLINAEYRFPVFGPVGGAVFADVGNVYKDSTIRLDQLRYGLGFGVRYLSPVGPLRVDVGWPLRRRTYEDSFTYFITLGYAF